MNVNPEVEAFFDKRTSTLSYLVLCPETKRAVIIDPVLDFDLRSGRVSTEGADKILAKVEDLGARIDLILETHPHADHLSAAGYLKTELGCKTAIGAGIVEVQRTWKAIYNLTDEVPANGSQFDRLLADGDEIKVGTLTVKAMATPGHTPACCSYLIGDCAFVGDLIFMPDYGSARTDFPGGDARTLYRSIQRVFALEPETKLYTCHDYQPGGRDLKWMATVAEQRTQNIHLRDGTKEDAFVTLRETRDEELDPPHLLLPALQVNIRGGRLPDPEANGTVYLRIPVNRF